MKRNLILFMFLLFTSILSAQDNAEKEVAKRVELLRKAMESADGNSLKELTAKQLSYGHSAGYVEGKDEFIRKLTSAENDFVTITLSNQSISISGKAAIVRHRLDAETMDGGKSNVIKLLVLMVWQKQEKEWKLLARQAVKILP